MSVCDNLSVGSLSDSLSWQLVELYHPIIRNGIAADMMVNFQYSNRKELKTADSSGWQQHIVWQSMGETPRNIDYNQSAM